MSGHGVGYPVSDFSHSGADFCLLSSEHGEPGSENYQPCTIFKVERSRIASTFNVLADMLEIGGVTDEQVPFEGLLMVQLGESCQTIELLVRLASNNPSQLPNLSRVTTHELLDAYSTAAKYDGSLTGLIIEAEIRLRVPQMSPKEALICMGHAERFDLPLLLKDTRRAIQASDLATHLEFAATVLTAPTLAQLAREYINRMKGKCWTAQYDLSSVRGRLQGCQLDICQKLERLQNLMEEMNRGIIPA